MMTKFKKFLITVVLTVVILALTAFLFCYWVGTWNSKVPSLLFNTTVEYAQKQQGSFWKCDSWNLEAFVTENSRGYCMIITDKNTNSEYTLQIMGFFSADIFPTTKTPMLDDTPLSTVEIHSKKRWGKLYKFVIKGVNKDCWYESGNDSISFELVEEHTSE